MARIFIAFYQCCLSYIYCGGCIGQSINLAHVGEDAWHACALMLESVTFWGSQFIALIPCLTTTTTPRRHYPCITMICQETHSPPNTRMCTWLQVWDSDLFAPVQAIPQQVPHFQTFLSILSCSTFSLCWFYLVQFVFICLENMIRKKYIILAILDALLSS